MEMQITFNYVCPSVYWNFPCQCFWNYVMCQLLFSCDNNFREKPQFNQSKTKKKLEITRIRCSYWFVPVGDEMKFYCQVCLFHGFTRMGTMTDCILI
jgi:hypothetical protein